MCRTEEEAFEKGSVLMRTLDLDVVPMREEDTWCEKCGEIRTPTHCLGCRARELTKEEKRGE